jgi:hypothetical protein
MERYDIVDGSRVSYGADGCSGTGRTMVGGVLREVA